VEPLPELLVFSETRFTSLFPEVYDGSDIPEQRIYRIVNIYKLKNKYVPATNVQL
jgi:hypothetical protein